MEVLCALFIVLAVITVVGHGLWVLAAAILRAAVAADTAGDQLDRPPVRCLNCSCTLPPLAVRCAACGLPRAAVAQLADLRVTLRQLTELRGAGRLDADTFDRLRGLLDQRRREIDGDVPAAAPAREQPRPAAVPAPVVAPAPVVKPVRVKPQAAPVVAASKAVVASPPPPPPAPPAPPAPRWTLAEWLAAFMEERNILWGELVGGLLVVGCSAALVLSLWQTLEQIPLFPFLILLAVTAALFGVGQYTLRQWRLESTSRGLLAIAILLVPLNFLVLAGLLPVSSELWEVAVKLATVPLFAWLVYRAAAVLFPEPENEPPARRRGTDAGLLTLAVLGAAVGPLAGPRLLGGSEPASVIFLLLAAWPVACHGLGLGLAVRRRWSSGGEPRSARTLLGMTGLAVFPLALALGFLVYWVAAQGGNPGEALEGLAGLVALAGVPTLAAGLLVQQRLAGPAAVRHGLLAAVGTGVALLGLLVLLAALGCAWPQPGPLLLVGVLDFVVLTGVAIGFRLPPAHAFALASLGVAYLAGYHLFMGWPADLTRAERAAWLLRQTFSGTGGVALAGLVTLLAVAADRLRGRRPADAVYYAASAGLVGLLSVVLVAVPAAAEPARAAAVGGWYAAGCLLLGRRWRMPHLLRAGSFLLLAATVAALHWLRPGAWAEWGAVLAAEALLGCAVVGPWGPAALVAAALAVAGSVADNTGLHSAWPTLTAVLLTAAALVRAGRSRRPGWTRVGSGLLLVGIAHAVLLWAEPPPPLPWAAVLLLHATLTLPAGLILGRRAGAARNRFGMPLTWSALGSTLLAVPVALAGMERTALPPLAEYAGWLALLWLAAACVEAWSGWFTAFQAAASASVLFAVAAWLDRTALSPVPADFADPHSLRRFALGLAALAVVWVALRLALRGRAAARLLLEPPWPAPDWVLLGGLVLGQLGLAAAGVTPGVLHELGPAAGGFGEGVFHLTYSQATDGASWLLVGLLSAALAGSLWDLRGAAWETLVLLGLLGIAVTVPVLGAGSWAPELATASALRWDLAAVFLFASVPFWGREALARTAARAGIEPAAGARELRAALVAGTAIPVVLLTITAAGLVLSGWPSGGPTADSFFGRIGPLLAHGVPLALVAAGLVGHALRERSPGYALAGGAVVNLIVTGGYALGLAVRGAPIDVVAWVHLGQRFAVTAGAWAVAWFVLAEYLRRCDPVPRSAPSPLWAVQRGLAVAGIAAVLGATALRLAVAGPSEAAGAADFPLPAPWTDAAGSWPGWLALGLAVAAGVLPARTTRTRLPAAVLGLGGLGVVALLACALAERGPGWGYHTLLFGSAACALLEAVPAGRRPERRSEDLAPWVGVGALLTAALAWQAAVVHAERLPGALAVGAASAAAGWVGLRRRRDDWVLVAGLGVHLAASLFVWHGFGAAPLGAWAVPLLQANGLAAAVVALVWGLSRRPADEPTVRAAVALPDVPLAVAAAAQAVLLVLPALVLLGRPEAATDPRILQAGQALGGVGLLATLAAWLVALPRLGAGWRNRVWGTFGLLAGAWLACRVAHWDRGDWLAYHTLLSAWAAAGALALLAGRASRVVWVPVFAGLVSVFALRAAWEDPYRPYAPALAALAASALMGGLALAARRAAAVAASGLLFNLAGLITWVAWGPWTLPGFAAANVFGLAAAAVLWSAHDRPLSAPFRHPVAGIGVAVLAALAGWGVLAPAGAAAVTGPLTWSAWGAAVVAAAGCLREPDVAFAPPALYTAGLSGVALALLEAGWSGAPFLRAAAIALAGYVLLAQALAVWGRHLLAWMHVDDDGEAEWPWFLPAQAVVGGVALALSVGVALAGGEPIERAAGPLAVALVLPAAALLAEQTAGRRGQVLVSATLGLAVLLIAEVGWAAVDLAGSAVALRRSVAVVAALALGTVGCSFGLARLRAGRWAEAARRAGPVLGLAGSVALAAVVAQEGALFDPVTKHTPLGPAAVALVGASLVGLIVAAFAFALRPWTDPFGLSERRRPLYVYAAELLLVLTFLHLRYNVPGLFPPVRAQHWPFIVIAVAFLGVGLGEFFRARKVDVLAGPLLRTGVFLPLLPLVVFWLNPPEAVRSALVERFPGALPLLAYLDKFPRRYDAYAVLWLLFGGLYAWLAVARRSYWYTLAAALAGNVGLWALLHHSQVAFLAHPQVWLIPLALIILASEQHHRARLAPEAAAGLRYLGLGTLYVSSTADLFIAGLGNSVVLPLALAVLSVLGVLAGILLRVRSYLYLGAGFLGLVVFSMIWHAAVDRHQPWVWWASGVVLGGAILALFGLFEKRRPEVLRALGGIRSWR